MVEETSLLDPWQFAVLIGVAALVMSALESRVKDQKTGLVAGVLAGLFVAIFTPAASILSDVVATVRGLILG